MHRLTSTVTLALLAMIIVAPAALAQTGEPPDGITDERYSTEQTRAAASAVSEHLDEFNANQAEIDRLDAIDPWNQTDAQQARLDELEARQDELDSVYDAKVEELISARISAIEDAPGGSSVELRDKQEASEQLQAYAEEELSMSSDLYPTDFDSGTYPDYEDEIQASQESQDNSSAAANEPSGNDASGGPATDPLAAVSSIVGAIVSFVFGLIFLWILALGVMFGVAWRLEGSASVAWASTMRPGRIALAFLIAFVLSLLGGISTLINILLLALIAGGVALYLMRRREGSTAGAMERLRSWLPDLLRAGAYEDSGSAGYDEDRRGRNVAGAKGEAQVNEALTGLVRAGLYGYVFANLAEPSVGNIDHVIVGRGGTWIVETKANKGEIVLDENGNVTANGKPFARDPFEQALGQLNAMSHRIGDIDGDILVCVAAAKDIQYPEEETGRADRLVSLLGLEATVASVGGEKPTSEVDRIAEQIMGHYGTAPIASPTGPPSPGQSGPSRRSGDTREQGSSFQGATDHLKKSGPPKRSEHTELTPQMRERLKNMEAIMGERIVGQQRAVSEVSAAARRRLAGGFGGERPSSFLFLGPTGVGKTEVANTLADELHGGKERMIRLDMSEYKNAGDIARLTGAPAGYIGHDASNPLTDWMYEDPSRLVLFDEIEKADPDVWNVLLQILDAGRLTDGHGNEIPFGDATVILTSNLLTREITEHQQQGEEIDDAALKAALIEEGIKPEILNRIGRIITFDPLMMDDVREVARRMLSSTTEGMRERHGIEVSFGEDAVARIAELGYEPEFGARPLRAVIEREVEDKLSDMLLEEKIGRGDSIEFGVDEEGRLRVRPAGAGQRHNQY